MYKNNEPPKEPKPKYESPAQTKLTAEEMINIITSNLAPNDIRELLGFPKLENAEHEHKWVHMETDKQEEHFTHGYNRGLTRKDQFFCEKCLKRKTIVKKGTKYINEDYPDWW